MTQDPRKELRDWLNDLLSDLAETTSRLTQFSKAVERIDLWSSRPTIAASPCIICGCYGLMADHGRHCRECRKEIECGAEVTRAMREDRVEESEG